MTGTKTNHPAFEAARHRPLARCLGAALFIMLMPALLTAQEDDFASEIEAELNGQQPETNNSARPSQANAQQPANQPSVNGTAAGGQNQTGGSLIDRASIPNIWAVGDLTSQQYLEETRSHDTHVLRLREAELGLNAGIDQLAVGTFTMAAHNENGELFLEMHEMFMEFNTLPWNLYLKLGRMFPDLGRLNTIHIHGRPFTFAPLIHRAIFNDDEGTIDTGGELSYLMPWDFFQEVKFGIYTGRIMGHAHNNGVNKPLPLLNLRLKHFVPFGSRWGLQFGFTGAHYNPTENPGDVDYMGGTDLRLKYNRGRLEGFEVGAESWYRKSPRADSYDEDLFGWYVYTEYQPFQQWKFGARYGYSVEIDKYSAVLDRTFNSADSEQSVWVGFIPSEFSYLRLTFSREDIYLVEPDDLSVIAQADYIIGFHPPHKY